MLVQKGFQLIVSVAAGAPCKNGDDSLFKMLCKYLLSWTSVKDLKFPSSLCKTIFFTFYLLYANYLVTQGIFKECA